MGILGKNLGKQTEQLFRGGYKLQSPIETDYGTATHSYDFPGLMRQRDALNASGYFPAPDNKQRETKSFIKQPGDVKGVAQDYEAALNTDLQGPIQQPQQPQATQVPQTWQVKMENIPEIKGRSPIAEITPDEETIQKYVKNAKKWAGTGTTNPNQANLTYRYNVSPETLAENAEFVGQYVEAIMRLAPYFDLPPKTVASMVMQESGWGGQRFGGNLGGYGFPGDGTVDQGYRFDAPTIEGMAARYLEQLSKYRYAGSRSPEDFHNRGYNTHKEYPGSVRNIMSMLEAK